VPLSDLDVVSFGSGCCSRVLTRRYLDAWLAERAYYQLELAGRTENPDQRISEDLNQFTAYVVSLSLGLLTSVASLGSFLVILWGLSGPAEISLGKWGTVHIPAYLVRAAVPTPVSELG
jgi:vitamin B12/bleomycin/antimicrobial peptide transport system ATP-binding/permease protein